jgi:hypothetical protein
MATNKSTGVMICSLGGALLISLVTEIITATHHWRMLSGVPLIAMGEGGVHGMDPDLVDGLGGLGDSG